MLMHNGYKIYVDILMLIQVANMDSFIGWGKWGGWEGIVILASCEYHCIRVHENLVQHPSNNIAIICIQVQKHGR